MEFFVSIDGKKEGPFTLFRVTEMLRDGEISADTLCWRKGLSEWQKAAEIPALQTVIADEEKRQASQIEDEDSQEEVESKPTPPLPSENETPAVRPGVRFWARSFDYMLVTVAVWTFSGVSPDIDPNLSPSEFWQAYLKEFEKEEWQLFARMVFFVQLGWHVLEGLLLHVFGTTPGKALFGIRIAREGGLPPTILQALGRSFYVYFGGVFCYLFPFSLMAILFSFFRLLSAGKCFWDQHLQTTVIHKPLTAARILVAVAAFFALFVLQSLTFS